MRAVLFLSFLFLVYAGEGEAAFAQNLDFDTVQASTGSTHAVHPSVGVSESGRTMVVWWDLARQRIVTRTHAQDTGWGPVLDIPGQGAPGNQWPRIKGGNGNDFHITWSRGTADNEHFHDILYVHYHNGQFGPVELVQSSYGMWPDLCFHKDSGTVSVCWEEYLAHQANIEIMVRQRINGQWSAKTNASKHHYSSGRSKISCDDKGNLFVVWQQKTQLGHGSELYEAYYNRTVSGQWQTPVALTTDNAWRRLPNVAVNSDGSEVFTQWYNYSDKYHWGRTIRYVGNQPILGNPHRIGRGSLDHLHYYTALVYHFNTLHISYVGGDGNVWLKNYLGNDLWGEGGILPGVSCPRTPDLAESDSLGLALCWYDKCSSPNRVYLATGYGLGEGPSPQPNQPPIARILLSPDSGLYPLSVNFDGTTSSDPDGSIVSYDWTLGDGSGSTNTQFTHTYQTTGVYTVSLTVTDNRGASAKADALVTVFGVEPPLGITQEYRQNRNVFSIEHYYRIRWQNNPVNESRGTRIEFFNIYRRPRGETNWIHLTMVSREFGTEHLDRSLKNKFTDYEYTVSSQDIEGRQSPLPD